MPTNHIKRISAPRSWNIRRKNKRWIARARSGHSLGNSISVAVVMRDMLKYAKTLRDVKNIVNTKTLLVNSRKVKDLHLGVGVMDIFEIPELNEKYIILLNRLGKLIISKTKIDSRISKIIGKKKTGKKIQLNLFGGGNEIVEKDSYKTGDSVSINAKGKVKEHLKLEEGANCFLTGGSHIGEFGKVAKIEGKKVAVKGEEGEFETLKDFIYVIGKEIIKAEK